MEIANLEGCDVCGEDHETEACPVLGFGLPSEDQQNQLSRARLTLPHFVKIEEDADSGLNVVAKEVIAAKTKLGPFEAKRTTQDIEADEGFILKILSKDGTCVCLETGDENECNWLCLVQTALESAEQNCMAVQIGTEIFYMVTKEVVMGEALRVWYAPHYAKKLGKSPEPDGRTRVLCGQQRMVIQQQPLEVVMLVPEDASDEQVTQAILSSVGDLNSQTEIQLQHIGGNGGPEMYCCKHCHLAFPTQTLAHIHELAAHTKPQEVAVEAANNEEASMASYPKLTPMTKSVLSSLAVPRKSHIIHPTDNVGKQKCRRCDCTFDDVRDLATHVKLHLRGDTKDEELTLRKEKADSLAPTKGKRGRKRKLHKKTEVTEMEDASQEITPPRASDIRTRSKSKQEEQPSPTKSPKQVVSATRRSSRQIKPTEKMKGLEKGRVILPTNEQKSIEVVWADLEDTETQEKREDPDQENSEEVNIKESSVKLVDITESPPETKTAEEEQDTRVLATVLNIKGTSGVSEKMEEEAVDTEEGVGVEHKENEEQDEGIEIPEELKHIGTITFPVSGEEEEEAPVAEEGEGALKENVDETATGKNEEDEKHKSDMDNQEDTATGDVENQEEADSAAAQFDAEPIIAVNDLASTEQGEVTEKADKDIELDGLTLQKDKSYDDYDLYLDEKNQSYFGCKKCHKKFLRLHLLTKHSCVTDKKNAFNCNKCNRGFSTKVHLLQHKCLGKVSDDGIEIFTCDQCGKSFEKLKNLQRHLMGHTDIFQCKKCQRSFSRKDSLLKHNCTAKKDTTVGSSDEKSDEKYFCEFCGMEFRTKKYLLRHMAAHTGEYTCKVCGREFTRKESLLQHLSRVHPEEEQCEGENLYPCKLCIKVFTREVSLQNHMMLHTEEHKCSKCGKCFTSPFNLDRHTCNDPPEADEHNTYSCKECGKTFRKELYLTRHMAIHTGIFSCPICQRQYGRKEELVKHMLECTANIQVLTNGEIKCNYCDEVFTDPPAFRIHYTKHTHPFKCEECGRYFLRKINMDNHKCEPWDGEPVECNICKKKFRHPRYLQRHSVIHGEARYTCHRCKKKFFRIDHYNEHTCISEDGAKIRVKRYAKREDFITNQQHICPTCGKGYSSVSNLNKHMITHGEKNEVCEVCGKKFHLKVALREHMTSVHSDTYRHQCQYCGKYMKCRNSIFGHIKQFHSETLVMYQCETCGKQFRQKGNLKKHALTHIDARTFKCQFCDKRYKYPEQLRRHEKWHKEGQRFECEFCERKFVMQFELNKHIKVFHSGSVYVCQYCYTECRHYHTMKRHLQRRHADIQEWKEDTINFIKEMIQTGKYPASIPVSHQAALETTMPSDTAAVTTATSIPVTTTVPTSLSDVALQSLIAPTSINSQQPLIVAEVSGINSSGNAGDTQTVIIQTGPNQFETDGLVSQEVAAALQQLSNHGALDDQGSTMTIIGDITQSDGQSVPVALTSDGLPDSQGYIIVPMVKNEQQVSVNNAVVSEPQSILNVFE